eukprot:1144262-Pelagomonas_calceolata.AAC.2
MEEQSASAATAAALMQTGGKPLTEVDILHNQQQLQQQGLGFVLQSCLHAVRLVIFGAALGLAARPYSCYISLGNSDVPKGLGKNKAAGTKTCELLEKAQNTAETTRLVLASIYCRLQAMPTPTGGWGPLENTGRSWVLGGGNCLNNWHVSFACVELPVCRASLGTKGRVSLGSKGIPGLARNQGRVELGKWGRSVPLAFHPAFNIVGCQPSVVIPQAFKTTWKLPCMSFQPMMEIRCNVCLILLVLGCSTIVQLNCHFATCLYRGLQFIQNCKLCSYSSLKQSIRGCLAHTALCACQASDYNLNGLKWQALVLSQTFSLCIC